MRSSARPSAPIRQEPSTEALLPVEPPRIEPREAEQADPGQPSPALLLRLRLEQELSTPPEQKWSVRRTVGFLVIVNGAFWIAALWLATRLF
jgi:hypothetical protein